MCVCHSRAAPCQNVAEGEGMGLTVGVLCMSELRAAFVRAFRGCLCRKKGTAKRQAWNRSGGLLRGTLCLRLVFLTEDPESHRVLTSS